MEKKLLTQIYFVGIAIIIIAFSAGLFIGYNMRFNSETQISSMLRDLELSTESYSLEQQMTQLSNEDSCKLIELRMDDMAKELKSIGKLVNDPEYAKTLSKSEFSFLKNKYFLLEIKAYTFTGKMKSQCGRSPNVILYYYSPHSSVDIGPMLDKVSLNYNVRVFPVEYNVSKDLSFLQSYYEIKNTPAIVVNYDHKIEGQFSYDQIENLLLGNVTRK